MGDRSDLATYVRNGSAAGLRYERRYDRPVETVWKALTEPARLADWMGTARVEPYVGGRYELFIDSPQPMRGRVVTWQPPELLEYSWHSVGAPASLVRCELVPDGAGTRLIFRHRAFQFAASCLSLGVFRMSDFKQPIGPRRQFANITLVLLIHAGLLYALVSGLGHSMVQVFHDAAEVRVIEDIKPLDTPPPLPAPPKLLPPASTFVLPEIKVTTPSQSQLQVSPPDVVPPAPPMADEQRPAPPVRVAPVIDAARSCTLPQYPAVSVRLGEEGAVDLEFLIDLDGRVADSRIAKSSGHARLDEAARAALALCRFSPGTVDGKPERSWGHLLYRWRLDQ
jgi:protein TonB